MSTIALTRFSTYMFFPCLKIISPETTGVTIKIVFRRTHWSLDTVRTYLHNSCKMHGNPLRLLILLYLFCPWANRGTRRLRHFVELTKIASDRAIIQTWEFWHQRAQACNHVSALPAICFIVSADFIHSECAVIVLEWISVVQQVYLMTLTLSVKILSVKILLLICYLGNFF